MAARRLFLISLLLTVLRCAAPAPELGASTAPEVERALREAVVREGRRELSASDEATNASATIAPDAGARHQRARSR
jgi:hypothetical protein